MLPAFFRESNGKKYCFRIKHDFKSKQDTSCKDKGRKEPTNGREKKNRGKWHSIDFYWQFQAEKNSLLSAQPFDIAHEKEKSPDISISLVDRNSKLFSHLFISELEMQSKFCRRKIAAKPFRYAQTFSIQFLLLKTRKPDTTAISNPHFFFFFRLINKSGF